MSTPRLDLRCRPIPLLAAACLLAVGGAAATSSGRLAAHAPRGLESRTAGVTEYTALFESSATNATDPSSDEHSKYSFVLKAFEYESEDGPVLLVVATGDVEASKNLSLGVVHLGGEPVVEIEDPSGRLLSRTLLPFLLHEQAPAQIAQGSTGTLPIDLSALMLSKVIVNFRFGPASPAGEGVEKSSAGERGAKEVEPPILFSLELGAAPAPHSNGAMQTTLKAFQRDFYFDRATSRLQRMSWRHTVERKFGSRAPITYSETMEIAIKGRRELTPIESKQLASEYEQLAPVLEATLPGADHLLRKSKEGKKLEEKFKSYRSKHDGGLLAEAVPELDRRLRKVLERLSLPEDPEDVAKLMRGKPAPGFTLTDLQGKKVSLEDFKGKAVLLNFWAVL